MARITALTKPVARRIGRLCVRIEEDGLLLKGYRRRRWHKLTWAAAAKLACKLDPPLPPGWSEKQWQDVLKTIGAK